MTADERIALIGPKIERAKKYIIELEANVRTFLDANPYKVSAKRNPQTRQLIYYLSEVTQTPISFPVIVGEVIQNLRSALDHLAYQLYLVGTNSISSPARHIYFPIGGDPTAAAKYETFFKGKVKGMRQDTVDAIKAIEPYEGGNGHDFWVLHTLNNIDKHRLLVTVGSAYQGFDAGALMIQRLRQATGRDIPEVSVYLTPADNLFPLKVGDELFIDAPDAELNEKMQFRFDVALNEPGVVEGKPVLPLVQQLADLVANTVVNFHRFLS
jgi:hypothetical protein